MKVEALVFDMDGLLLDSERVVQRSWNYAGEKLGYRRIGEHIYHTLGFNVVRREAYFKSVYGEDFPMDKFNELTREKYYGICDKEGIGVKEGARELLIYAKEHGYKVGLATSSREIHAKVSLEKVGLWKYFDGGNMQSRIRKFTSKRARRSAPSRYIVLRLKMHRQESARLRLRV